MAQLASTPVGMEVRAVVRLSGVNDRRLTFMFEAFDAVEKICEGIHERYIIDIEWFKRRIDRSCGRWVDGLPGGTCSKGEQHCGIDVIAPEPPVRAIPDKGQDLAGIPLFEPGRVLQYNGVSAREVCRSSPSRERASHQSS